MEILSSSPSKPGQPSRLEQQITVILLQAGVPTTEIDRCMTWAFGPDAWRLAPAEWWKRWNKLHPTAFRATPKEKFVEFIYVVGFYFVEQSIKAEQRGHGNGQAN